MKINENQWKSMKINENQWELMKINEKQWKSMTINENSWNGRDVNVLAHFASTCRVQMCYARFWIFEIPVLAYSKIPVLASEFFRENVLAFSC